MMEKKLSNTKNNGMNSPFKILPFSNGLGPSQILIIERDPISSLIHSFFNKKLTIYDGQSVIHKYKLN